MTHGTPSKRNRLTQSVNHALNARFWLTLLLATLALSMIGPFGTYTEMTFGSRLIYWAILIFGIGGIMIFVARPFLWLQVRYGMPVAVCLAIGTAVAAIPGTAIVYFMNGWMRSSVLERSLTDIAVTWINVAFVGLLISLIETARHGIPDLPRWMPRPPNKDDGEAKTDTGLVASLDLKNRFETRPDTVISMTMQDHYVHITSAAGTEMVLLRFSDAIAHMGPVDGAQIHRSHWVAWAHVVDFNRDGHTGTVTLSDGRSLPVSRSHVAAVQTRMAQTV